MHPGLSSAARLHRVGIHSLQLWIRIIRPIWTLLFFFCARLAPHGSIYVLRCLMISSMSSDSSVRVNILVRNACKEVRILLSGPKCRGFVHTRYQTYIVENTLQNFKMCCDCIRSPWRFDPCFTKVNSLAREMFSKSLRCFDTFK